jgi:hypothetical protein
MPEIIECPQCGRKLRMPETLLGKTVKCPGCATAFRAGAEPQYAPPPEQYDQPPSHRRRPPEDEYEQDRPRARYDDEDEGSPYQRGGRPQDWHKVRTGVTLVFTSLCLTIVSAIILVVAFIIVNLASNPTRQTAPGRPPVVTQPTPQSTTGLTIVMVFAVLLSLVVQGVQITGYGLCLAAPPKNRAKGLAMATLGLSLGALLVILIGEVLATVSGVAAAGTQAVTSGGFASIVLQFGVLFWLGAVFIFLLFLRSISNLVGALGLAQSLLYLTILAGLLLLGLLTMTILIAILTLTLSAAAGPSGVTDTSAAAPGLTTAVGGCCCINGVLGLATLIWYMISLMQVRGAITTYLIRER